MSDTKTISVKFPHDKVYEFEKGKPVVILGANGSGKTRLSVRIEVLNDKSFQNPYDSSNLLVHRIGAQKSLSISETIIIKDFETAEQEAYTGAANRTYGNRYTAKYKLHPATNMIDDFGKMLTLFFSTHNKQMEEYFLECRKSQSINTTKPEAPKSLKENVQDIWNYLLPHREIDLSNNEVYAKYNDGRYHGAHMSDGERVMLYMIIQVLSIKKSSVLIIDEPELHIHKAILNKLWDKLEQVRQDCVFMYITHDLDFAVSRNIEEVLWVKSYDGKDKWDYESLPLQNHSDIPEGLLFELIGTQKKIVFVEGTKDSLDYLIYQELYKDKNYHVIPCGGCAEVMKYVRAKKEYSKLSNIQVYGIIDRDFRNQETIDKLKEDNIYVIEVAEIENLFFVPELLEFSRKQLGHDSNWINEIKKSILELFNNNKAKQVTAAFASEINYQLHGFNVNEKSNNESVKAEIDTIFSKERIEAIYEKKKDIFNKVTKYEEVIRNFNYKDLSNKISRQIGLSQNLPYKKFILNLLKRSEDPRIKAEIINAIKPYIPELP